MKLLSKIIQHRWTLPIVASMTGLAVLLIGRKALAGKKVLPTPIWNFSPPLTKMHVNSGWWDPRDYRNGVHEGFDLRAKVGTPIFAIADGIVTNVNPSPGTTAGLYVILLHERGLYSRYLHLNGIVSDLKVNQRVTRGQHIGWSGQSTTTMTSGTPHLHFDFMIDLRYLPLYVERFGTPNTQDSRVTTIPGFGSRRKASGGPFKGFEIISVPAEPLMPADEYADTVVSRAAAHGIPLAVKNPVIHS